MVFGGERRLVGAFKRNERREVRALARQLLGELEAGARRSRIRIDRVVKNAEAVLVAQLLVGLPHIRDLAKVTRISVGIERRAPQRALSARATENQQRVGLLAAVSRALVGDVGCSCGALEKVGALAV